ncbi:MAG: hypothetical protein ACFFF4_17695 [Candidatus Thorarchaeota archaeon]
MVEFVKGKALLGAIIVLVGGLLEVVTTIQGFLDPDTWTVFETNATVIIPGIVTLIFGILVVVGGLLVAVGSSKGNYFAIILGLIIIIFWHFILPPPAPLPYDTYVKVTAAPFLYLVGGLFGLSIAEE